MFYNGRIQYPHNVHFFHIFLQINQSSVFLHLFFTTRLCCFFYADPVASPVSGRFLFSFEGLLRTFAPFLDFDAALKVTFAFFNVKVMALAYFVLSLIEPSGLTLSPTPTNEFPKPGISSSKTSSWNSLSTG